MTATAQKTSITHRETRANYRDAATRAEELRADPKYVRVAVRRQSVWNGGHFSVLCYETKEVSTRTRLRGTCQFCGGQQVVKNGVIVLHGYKRPGNGYTYGRCPGAKLRPAEHSVKESHEFIDALRKKADRAEVELVRLGWNNPTTVWGILKTREDRDLYRDLSHTMRGDRQHAEYLTDSILPRLGKDLAAEEVA